MSLREWDRKAQVLAEELTTLMQQAGEKSSDDTEKKLSSMQKSLPQLENKLAQALSFINSQSQRSGFLTSQEKAILHWAGEYAKKAQAYFRDYNETFNELFWAKLVQIRGESISAHGEGYFFEAKGRRAAAKHQKKLYETRGMLKEKLKKLGNKNQELELRYNRLAISKANREAVCAQGVKVDYFRQLNSFMNHPARIVSLPFEYLNQEAIKLANLTTNIQNSDKIHELAYKNSPKHNKNPIESFDYLQLDDPYEI
ncbi:MAG: hypothetical protein AB8G05_20595 [Oligoflexales bacterium]